MRLWKRTETSMHQSLQEGKRKQKQNKQKTTTTTKNGRPTERQLAALPSPIKECDTFINYRPSTLT
jgi:hypothetical protein